MTAIHHATPSSEHVQAVSPWLTQEAFLTALRDVHDCGYAVINNVMNESEVEAYRKVLHAHMDQSPTGRNVFEGTRSHRLYALLAKSPMFADMIQHPLAMAFAEHFLGPSCLLSACLSINLHPGETEQPWHTDDSHISIPQPHDIFGISAFWALDDTDEHNGATEILPFSHRCTGSEIEGRLDDAHFSQRDDLDAKATQNSAAMKAIMPAGSVMIMRGDTWHRGGANHSEQDRMIVTPQYCAGWARPLETMLLAVPPEKAAHFPKRTQELLGYSIHTPFMGYVDGMHPSRVLQ